MFRGWKRGKQRKICEGKKKAEEILAEETEMEGERETEAQIALQRNRRSGNI